MKYFIANWKNHKSIDDVNLWLDDFLKNDFSFLKDVEIIILPPYQYLIEIKKRIINFPFIKLGSQDISFFEEGSTTGEISAEILKELVSYVLIGHSERRYYFGETDRILFQKNSLAIENGIKTIFCIRNESDILPSRIDFLAYEPISAIGTNNNEEISKVLEVKKRTRLHPETKFIYGGSVNEDNVNQYIKSNEIDGVLVGTASLDPKKFFKIVSSL